ncbi:hypothetical protein R3I93_022768 [Phoxinus phoxinus]|uniref:SWIM-type domain-containing protein n=1 Tax=Phoxinus phoxinus TaxID=58324 RepID=A0AAN9C4Q2_9TELE
MDYSDIYHYLVESPSLYTSETMKNKRSLEAHKFFVSGWVQAVLHIKTDKCFVFKSSVKPSWRVTNKPHNTWVAVENSGKVRAAHCDCMAGLGESCSHVGAVLYKLEASVRLGITTTVQLQMFVCAAQYADFVTWTPQQTTIFRILKDDAFIHGMVDVISRFWAKHIHPRLMTTMLQSETEPDSEGVDHQGCESDLSAHQSPAL